MPGGKAITFVSARGNSRHAFLRPADGSGVEEQIINDERLSGVSSVSSDGKLAFGQLNPTGENDLAVFELQGERKTTVFLKTPFDESVPTISPDGRWVAYVSDESGREEIYVLAFPGPGGRWQISTQGGRAPVWSRNGRELFYSSFDGASLMVVDITTQPTFKAGTPRVLLEGGFRLVSGALGPSFDVSADGQRFLMVQNNDANPTQLNVVLNWFEELKRRVRP
jgi:Tol biopolymer transport system component